MTRCAHSPTPEPRLSARSNRLSDRTARSESSHCAGRAAGSARADSSLAGCRLRSDGPGPLHLPSCCVRRVLCPVQDSPEPLEGRTFRAALCAIAQLAFRRDSYLGVDHLALVVEETLGAVDRFSEPAAQMSQTVHDCCSRQVAGVRVFAGVEVGIVAMRGRIGQLVAVGCPDGPEFAVMPCEISMDLGSKQASWVRAPHSRAARVIRSCSRFCPPLSIVPNPSRPALTRSTQPRRGTRQGSSAVVAPHDLPTVTTPNWPHRRLDRDEASTGGPGGGSRHRHPATARPAAASPREGGHVRKQRSPRFARSGETR